MAMALPFLPMGDWFGFVSPPLEQCGALVAVVAVYLIAAELLKYAAIGRR